MFTADGGGSRHVLGTGIAASMDQFAKSAASGGFAVNETGGHALIGAIDRLLAWIDDAGTNLYLLQQQPKLGDGGGAKTVSPFAKKVATDQQGFLTVLGQLQQSLRTAKQGINTAMANYQSDDTGNAGRFKQA